MPVLHNKNVYTLSRSASYKRQAWSSSAFTSRTQAWERRAFPHAKSAEPLNKIKYWFAEKGTQINVCISKHSMTQGLQRVQPADRNLFPMVVFPQPFGPMMYTLHKPRNISMVNAGRPRASRGSPTSTSFGSMFVSRPSIFLFKCIHGYFL